MEKLKKARLGLSCFAENGIVILAAAVLCMLSVLCFVQHAYMPMQGNEHMMYFRNGKTFYVLLIAAIVVLGGLLALIARVSVRVSDRKLYVVFAVLYLLAGCYLVFNVHTVLRADAKMVFRTALRFQEGNFRSLTVGHYFFKYPHQLGLLTLERILMRFSQDCRFFFFVYLLMVIAANFFLWKTTDLWFGHNRKINCLELVLSFAFFPQLFFTLFLYGTVPGMLLLSMAVYGFSRYWDGGRRRWFVLGLLAIVLSCLIRNNYSIAAIALFLLFVLRGIRQGRMRQLVLAAILILAIPVSTNLLQNFYRATTEINFGEGVPKVVYITMGLQEPGRYSLRESGWYNGYNDRLINQCDYDMDKVGKQAKKDLKERVVQMAKYPTYSARFFLRKIRSTWTDSVFQSVWSGPIERPDAYSKTKLLRDLYSGRMSYQALYMAGSVMLFLIYLFALLALLIRKWWTKSGFSNLMLFPFLYFLGGFVFHLFWETKSQYVYPYVLMLLPMTAYAMQWCGCRIKQRWDARRRSKQLDNGNNANE